MLCNPFDVNEMIKHIKCDAKNIKLNECDLTKHYKVEEVLDDGMLFRTSMD